MTPRRLCRAFSHLILLAACARVLGAQELRGTVREASSGLPIPGAVLLMLDSAGITRARNITDEHGVYRIVAAGWMRRLRVVRIGFRPTEVELPPIGLEVITTDVEMTSIPVLLEPVRVKTGAKCPKRDDRLAALSLLEQARAGLLATVVAREARPAVMVRAHFTSRLRQDSPEIESMTVRVDSTDTSHVSFVAPNSAGGFVQRGFAAQENDVAKFDAPDAETLLDDDFRDGYCFQLRAAEPGRPNQVGLGFVAATWKRGRIDIDGTLWIDTVGRRMKDIQFKYVNLPPNIQALQPGGQIQFRELANGVVIVDAWSLHLPAPVASEPRGTRRPRSGPLAVQLTGGAIASARWPGGLQWDAPLGVLRVHAFDAHGQPVAGREVLLSNTTYRGVLDSTGFTEIPRLVPGPYSAAVRDPDLDSIQVGLKITLTFNITDGETIDAPVKIPTAAAFVESRCQVSSISPKEAANFLIIGRAFDAAGKVVGPTVWKMSRRNEDFVDTWNQTTANDGIFDFCGSQFRLGDEVTIEARRSVTDPPATQVLRLTRLLTVVRLTLPPATK